MGLPHCIQDHDAAASNSGQYGLHHQRIIITWDQGRQRIHCLRGFESGRTRSVSTGSEWLASAVQTRHAYVLLRTHTVTGLGAGPLEYKSKCHCSRLCRNQDDRRYFSPHRLPRIHLTNQLMYNEAMAAKASSTALKTIPQRRFGTPEEIASAAVFLAGNSYANNCVLNLDGGLSAT